MNKLITFSLSAARWAYSRRKPSASSSPYFFAFDKEDEFSPCDYLGEQAGNYIKELLLKEKACMICRFGSNELNILLTYLTMTNGSSFLSKSSRYIAGTGGLFWTNYAKERMMSNAGIFPATDSIFCRFAERMLNDIKSIDVLGSWLFDEKWIKEEFFPAAVRVPLADLEPYYHQNPWSEVLRGKTVLVIHPYEESIREQYTKRNSLFRDHRVLPDFELKTLKAVQSIANTPVNFSNWFEALDYMCGQISDMEFDVAIIGAGAYGLSLASFIKKKGKKAVHLGGASQILFGIRGKKWDGMPFFQTLFNEHWVRPLPSETPENFGKVEGGVYW